MTNNYMNPNTNAMTPNAMNPAMAADMAAQQFILPEMVDDSFSSEDIGEDFDGIRLSFRKLQDFVGEQIPPMKAYAANFREQLKQSLEQRPMIADSVVEAEPIFDGVPAYRTVVQGSEPPIRSPYGVIDGDRDGLPM